MALFSLVAIFLIILDRYLKVLARLFWSDQAQELTKWFHLNYSLNNALAFSLPANKYFILIITILLLLILTALYLKKLRDRNPEALWWFIIILGATSNLIDRLFYGGVIDYLNVVWFTTFNLADCLITVGVGVLLLQEFFPKIQRRSDDSRLPII